MIVVFVVVVVDDDDDDDGDDNNNNNNNKPLPCGRKTATNQKREQRDFVVSWLLYFPATCQCNSWTDLPRQMHVLPH